MKEKLLSKPKILFVALGSSIHTARWIKQITDQGWDIHLFICDHSIHNILKEYEKDKKINIYGKIYHPVEYKIKIPIYVGRDSLIIRTIKRVLRLVINVIINPVILLPLLHNISLSLKQTHKMLASVISEIKPDIIHSLELQHNAYLTLKAKKIIRGQFPTWIVTNWGADIHYFGRFEEHRDMIKQVLASCDYYSSECHRDITLASNLGFKGIFLPVLPNAGGFNIEEIKKLKQDDKPSSRKTIAVKGAESWVYKGLHILKAIELCKELILDNKYNIIVYLPSDIVINEIERLRNEHGLHIQALPYVSHEEMLKLHGRSRISIGNNLSDGISTSCLEAIVMGSFPIQSNTSCAYEWITHGVNGFLVKPDDLLGLAKCIKQALTDDTLVDKAAEINQQILHQRLDEKIIKNQVVEIYKFVMTGSSC